MELRIYRGTFIVDKFNIDERTLFIQKFLGENYIHVEANVRKPLGNERVVPSNITIGDNIRYNGIEYYINTSPDITKTSTNQYAYVIDFESIYYDFAKVQFRYEDQGDYYLMGTLEDFVNLLITNMNRWEDLKTPVGTYWTNGGCTQTNVEYKLLKFDSENCRTVIQRLCTEFNGEFSFDRKIISFANEYSHDTGLTFVYKGNGITTGGLRNIQRQPIKSANIITRLYAFGSTKNIDFASYGKLRLELNTYGKNYIESNTGTYGTIEGSVIFEDVFPRRTGTVTSVLSDVLFIDLSMPNAFLDDLVPYLIPGMTAKVNFLTGNCAGYTFDIASYNDSTKKFEIIPVKLEDGSELPNVTLHPEATDKYVLIDITMPTSYVTAAEEELRLLAVTYLAKYDHPRVTYQIVPDWRYMKSHNANLTIGDKITIEDTDLSLNINVRIIELTQQLIEPYKYTLSLSDQFKDNNTNPTFKIILNAFMNAETAMRKIAASPVNDLLKTRRSWRDSEELRSMIFDPDGYFTQSIRPLSIETMFLSAGAKSGMFALRGIVIKPNYLGDINKLTITAGTLTHFAIDNTEDDEIGTWTLVANTTYEAGGLTTGTAYYLYAKCHKTNYTDAENQIIVSATAYKADQDPYWYFLVGILHSTAGVVPRGISLTYGQTLINGSFITTGKIQSANGLTYFDLDGNTLVIGSASGYANIGDKPTGLAGINATEGAKLTGIATGATVNATFAQDGIPTSLAAGDFWMDTNDGNKIYRAAMAGANEIKAGEWVVYDVYWGNLANVPISLTEDLTPAASGVYITQVGTTGFIGFFDQPTATWPVRIKNNAGAGEFYVGDGAKYISYAAGVLTEVCKVQTDTGLVGHYKRIVMDDTDNTLRFYNSTNVNVIVMDDTFEYAADSPGLYIGSTTGASIRLGNVAYGASASLYSDIRAGLMFIGNNATTSIDMVLTRRYGESGVGANFLADNATGFTGKLFEGRMNSVQQFAVDYQGIVNCVGGYMKSGVKVVGAQGAHIANASTSHSITDPANSPANADALRDDLVANTIPALETALNNLGTKINAILTMVETHGLVATS